MCYVCRQPVWPCLQITGRTQVVVGGTIDVFERDGRYQLYAKSITLDGAGLLYERYEQLKKELGGNGYVLPRV